MQDHRRAHGRRSPGVDHSSVFAAGSPFTATFWVETTLPSTFRVSVYSPGLVTSNTCVNSRGVSVVVALTPTNVVILSSFGSGGSTTTETLFAFRSVHSKVTVMPCFGFGALNPFGASIARSCFLISVTG